MKSGNLNFLEPSGLLQAFNGTALPSSFKCRERILSHNVNRSLPIDFKSTFLPVTKLSIILTVSIRKQFTEEFNYSCLWEENDYRFTENDHVTLPSNFCFYFFPWPLFCFTLICTFLVLFLSPVFHFTLLSSPHLRYIRAIFSDIYTDQVGWRGENFEFRNNWLLHTSPKTAVGFRF